ncbi:hypothetical protein FQR65_LT20329 [Abscondita terminalis]|nr:hypothetical protein FQR65_LT20329 [Abscondita terminalis]
MRWVLDVMLPGGRPASARGSENGSASFGLDVAGRLPGQALSTELVAGARIAAPRRGDGAERNASTGAIELGGLQLDRFARTAWWTHALE